MALLYGGMKHLHRHNHETHKHQLEDDDICDKALELVNQ